MFDCAEDPEEDESEHVSSDDLSVNEEQMLERRDGDSKLEVRIPATSPRHLPIDPTGNEMLVTTRDIVLRPTTDLDNNR